MDRRADIDIYGQMWHFFSFRCQDVGSEETHRGRTEEKCPFLESSGSEEDVLQVLQYMATMLGKCAVSVG